MTTKQQAAHDRSERAALKEEAEAAEAASQEAASQDAAQEKDQGDNSDKLQAAREVLLRHLGNKDLVDALEAFVRAVK